MRNDNLVELFCKLVRIPSPSGQEKAVAMSIRSYLAEHGIAVTIDQSGKQNNSNIGNLIAKIPGTKGLSTILFVAHMDTVETGEKVIQPKIKNGLIKSDGTTILGADNKASVACLIKMLKTISSWKVRPKVIAVFSTREESGMMGASLIRLHEKIDFAFNLDGPNVLGDFVYQTLGEIPFAVTFHGKAAHAAVEPEKGINALHAAAILITKLPLGKDRNGNVLNIGKISGGKANNVVPNEVVLSGQVRAYTQAGLQSLLMKIEQILKHVCLKTKCTYTFIKRPKEGAPPVAIAKGHLIIDLARKATKALNLEFSLSKGSYTSDANYLVKKYPTLTLGRGSSKPHSFEESITVKGLHDLEIMILEIVKQGAS